VVVGFDDDDHEVLGMNRLPAQKDPVPFSTDM
jgi:hypothetical protein